MYEFSTNYTKCEIIDDEEIEFSDSIVTPKLNARELYSATETNSYIDTNSVETRSTSNTDINLYMNSNKYVLKWDKRESPFRIIFRCFSGKLSRYYLTISLCRKQIPNWPLIEICHGTYVLYI